MKYLFSFLVGLFLISCQNQAPTSSPDLAEVQVNISGMTCEIGCAKLIESKLIKVNGVDFVEVIFQDSIGTIKYDKNRLSQEDLVQVIEGIAGGDLYTVKSIETTEETPSIP
ncbi:MAG: heavy-metal-associated domain-containing protein [Flavobacteriaceae bacterium]